MASSADGKIQYEAGQDLTAMELLTTSDRLTYYSSSKFWSDRSGYKPIVRPNGLISGCAITPAASAANDQVDVAAGKVFVKGVETSVSALTNIACARGGSSHMITSITVKSDGVVAAISGVTGTSFSATRGAAGGPPLLLPDSIEIGQVKYTSLTPAAVTAAEIFTVDGTHLEDYLSPSYLINYAKVVNLAQSYAGCEFATANPLIHLGAGTPVACTFDFTAGAAEDIVLKDAHGLSNGDTIYFSSGTLPAELDGVTKYFVVGKSDNYFQVSLTSGGTAVEFTDDGGAAFYSVLSGTAGRRVYAEFYEPIFADISRAVDFVPAETTHSVASTTYYGGAFATKSSSLGQGSFTAYLDSGVTDALIRVKNENLWFKYFPDRANTYPQIITQGYLGISRTYPADNEITAACTISSQNGSMEVAS
jgi:hypothetical protein